MIKLEDSSEEAFPSIVTDKHNRYLIVTGMNHNQFLVKPFAHSIGSILHKLTKSPECILLSHIIQKQTDNVIHSLCVLNLSVNKSMYHKLLYRNQQMHKERFVVFLVLNHLM